MSIHIQPIVFTVRGYHNDVNTSVPLHNLRNIPHKFMCTIQLLDTVAHITGFTGSINLSDRKEMSDILFNKYNVNEVTWRRGDRVISVKR